MYAISMRPTSLVHMVTLALVCPVALVSSACPVNTYGENCSTNCSQFCVKNGTSEVSACDNVTGDCLNGCTDGKEGSKCDRTNFDFPVGAIVGAIAAFLLLILIIVVVIVWRQRSTTKPKQINRRISEFSDGNQRSNKLINSVTQARKEGNTPEIQELQGTVINVKDLNDFILSHDRQYFEDQFEKIPQNQNSVMTVGQKPENIEKNRYQDVCAFDYSRVKLTTNTSKKQGDYINASYVMGYKEKEKFIASQGPTKVMINDFVRMLWEQKAEKVVMLTNLVEHAKTLCERYWPEDKTIQFDEITVELKSTEVFADYTIRKLELSKAEESSQRLTQFHFTSWPDKSLPSNPWSLADFEQQIYLTPTQQPIVVHCSAGVGRTGTFIALRNVVREAEDTGKLDFVSTIIKLRQERCLMVQTLEQFIFLHKAAQVALVCSGTSVSTDSITEKLKHLESESGTGKTPISEQFQEVCKLFMDNKEKTTEEKSGETVIDIYQNSSTLKLKNRFEDIVPKGYNRPFLMSDGDDINDYINAVFVPTLTRKDNSLLTQLPLPTTISDFWRLVTQYKVSLIVAFEMNLKDNDKTIVDYLPPDQDEPISCPPFEIRTGPVTLGDCWQEQRLHVTKHKPKKRRLSLGFSPTEDFSLVSLQCTTTDLDPKSALKLMRKVRSQKVEQEGRSLLMCRNGAEYSGLVCILSLLLDKMDHDQNVSVPLVVGSIKAIRPQVIPTLGQYSFLYKVLQRYVTWTSNENRKPGT